MKADLLFIDAETGGLDADRYSILSFGAVFWRDGRICDTLHLHIKEPSLVTEPQAMAINKIDLEWLAKNGLSPHVAVRKISEFVSGLEVTPRKLIRLAGHNVSFDISFVKRLFRLANVDYRSVFDHRSIDTFSLIAYLTLTNRIELPSERLDDIFEYFGIELEPGTRHSALADANATAALFDRLLLFMNESTF